MKKIVTVGLLLSFVASSLIMTESAFADFEAVKKGKHIAAYNCVTEKSKQYALATCERANDITSAVGGACRELISDWAMFTITDKRLEPLNLTQRLDIRDSITKAILSNVPTFVIEARIDAGKSCE